jgi:hypothetical protein
MKISKRSPSIPLKKGEEDNFIDSPLYKGGWGDLDNF